MAGHHIVSVGRADPAQPHSTLTPRCTPLRHVFRHDYATIRSLLPCATDVKSVVARDGGMMEGYSSPLGTLRVLSRMPRHLTDCDLNVF